MSGAIISFLIGGVIWVPTGFMLCAIFVASRDKKTYMDIVKKIFKDIADNIKLTTDYNDQAVRLGYKLAVNDFLRMLVRLKRKYTEGEK